MTFHKCSRCKLVRKETTKDFYKRISISFNLPFICCECVRIVACTRHPDFKKYIAKSAEEKKKKKKTIKCINDLGLPDEIVEEYKKWGTLSTCFLQRKFKMSFQEAKFIVDKVNEYVGESS